MDWHGSEDDLLCRVSDAPVTVALRILPCIVDIDRVHRFGDIGRGYRRVHVRGRGMALHLGPLGAFEHLLGLIGDRLRC